MAEKLKIPKDTIEANWKDDVDVEYAIYGGNNKKEAEFISPKHISKRAETRILKFEKARDIRLSQAAALGMGLGKNGELAA